MVEERINVLKGGSLFETTLLVLCAVLIAVLAAIMWWRIVGERVKALVEGFYVGWGHSTHC